MKLSKILDLYQGTKINAPVTIGLKGTSTMANSMLDCNCIDCGDDYNCINCD